ncbi:peptidoglycan bridge formation glycyltransferase FemA/FemB family protein [uncultured Dubosiella sp.]|uniref:peptidoglycan bridge formation glycyltransferase FemA/FemB family protein n=5 Tax=uncultured Dubosiella sp. TaxID=1937011 RepID=UPI0020844B8C|nr:peptidoglycan bridge formation glycyltransferase FemA/FemB family protein [uncultured Dubosiella sp.]GJM57114.1 methicillin resistance factor FemA [Erysipelotrichaceae bacterium OPF54]
MSNYEFTTQISQDEYDGFVRNHPNANLLQSWNWARIKSNWDHVYTAVKKDGQIEAAALVLIKNLPAGFTMLYIPRGPVMDWNDQELLDFYMKNLKKEAKKHHALFVKMDPPVVIGKYYSHNKERPHNGNEQLVNAFEKAGCIHQGFTTMIEESIQARFQSIIDKPEDLMASLPKKTKKLIKEAEKRDLEIISGREELVDEFTHLVEMTESRKHVSLRNREYFTKLLNTYKEDAIIMLAIADPQKIINKNEKKLADLDAQLAALPENHKKKRFILEEQKAGVVKDISNLQEIIDSLEDGTSPVAVAGVLTIVYGENAEMLYAGMDERFRRFMPQYKTYIENFQWAFDHGCTEFSMGGVEGTLDDGLTHFKDNFAPYIYEYIGEFDLPVLFYKPAKMLYEKKRHSMRES